MKGHLDIRRTVAPAALAITLLGVAACAPNYSPNTYDQRAVQQANKVEQGVIVGVRQVDIAAAGTTGAVAGAAAGGIAGATAQEGSLAALTALGGSVVGGILGTTVEKQINDTVGYEYIVRKANGDMVSVTQKDEKPLAIGLHVLVIAGPQARIVGDYTVPMETKSATSTPATSTPPIVPSATPPLPVPGPTATVAPSVETKPVETKPIEVKPLEPAPIILMPADTPPAPTSREFGAPSQ